MDEVAPGGRPDAGVPLGRGEDQVRRQPPGEVDVAALPPTDGVPVHLARGRRPTGACCPRTTRRTAPPRARGRRRRRAGRAAGDLEERRGHAPAEDRRGRGDRVTDADQPGDARPAVTPPAVRGSRCAAGRRAGRRSPVRPGPGSVHAARPGMARQAASKAARCRRSFSAASAVGRTRTTEKCPRSCRKTSTW